MRDPSDDEDLRHSPQKSAHWTSPALFLSRVAYRLRSIHVDHDLTSSHSDFVLSGRFRRGRDDVEQLSEDILCQFEVDRALPVSSGCC